MSSTNGDHEYEGRDYRDDSDDDDNDEYCMPSYTTRQTCTPKAIPATPSDFSDLFPSRRKLKVRHDNTTPDGDMNLRIDTQVINRNGRACDMTLFHLRMHDVQTREFSLRRYCRDSGREVCNSTRKTQKAITHQRRPSLQRSLSNALNSLRPRSAGESKLSSNGARLQRNDSGYGSMHSVDFARGEASRSGRDEAYQRLTSTTAPVKLEFSNYAQVEVKRSGSLKHRRCEFDYWGARYSWRRVTRRDGPSPSFHLLRSGSEHAVAYIVPCALTKAQEMHEQSRGNWVPPCTMWIADDTIVAAQKDISE
jgi:hypothetical protein